MIPFHNAMSIASESGKTYADFVTWANAQTAFDATATSATSSWTTDGGLFRVLLGAGYTGAMTGSPWGPGSLPPAYGLFTDSSRFSRIAQHAAISLAHASANLGRVVLVRIGFVFQDSSVGGLDRNGFLSSSASYDPDSPYRVRSCSQFHYFNDETGKRVHVNPFEATYQEFDL